MIKTVNEYKAYFAQLAASKGLSFVFGGTERILNRQAMDLTYPVLWVGIPEAKRKRDGALKIVFDGWFIVLSDAPTDDYEGQDDDLDAMLEKTEQLLMQMEHDAIYNQQFEFDAADAMSYYRGRQTADDGWGWFTEFELTGLHAQNINC